MNLDAFKPFVATEVIGCPDPLISQSLLMACAEFLRASMGWTVTLSPIALVDGQRDYQVPVPLDANLVAVRDVWVGARRLDAAPMATLRAYLIEESSEPTFYNMAADRGTLSVYPMPNGVTSQTLVLRVAYTPMPSASELPDFVWQNYLDVVASGAKARLMMMPGVPWTNPQLGAYYRQIFDAAVVDARIEEMHDRAPGRLTVQPRRFGF
jgi:hypothetical protein